MGLIVRYYGHADLIKEKGGTRDAVWRVQVVNRRLKPINDGEQDLYQYPYGVVSLALWDGDIYDIYRSIEAIKGIDSERWVDVVTGEIKGAFENTKQGLNETAWKDAAPRVERGIYMDAGEVDVF